jgi:MerR family transcriptional regulator, redox-sensitive transcriptional activator SoxR
MTIGDLARRVDLRTSAIRYYESLGLLPRAARISGRREYGDQALNTLKFIRAAQQAGFTLAETRALLAVLADGPQASRRWRTMASAKLDQLDATIAGLKAARKTLANAIDCRCAGKADACKLVAGGQPRSRIQTRRGSPT